ncbi:UDP-glycosyltransferase 88B1 [Artemisia annua]|uniref:Glycosyltransferase n=1 Tax=Artemisia annua TaxID=35608 RepID=A0A2U1QPH0_ARTAN|nr:UDP-glycosyltransferase 88B1 [Artemisia annua]
MQMESSTVVLYPSPGIGHLVSMVELGKLIQTHHSSLSIIILLIPATFETCATDKYIATVSATNPSLTFHHLSAITLPPGFSTEFLDLAFGIPELYNPIVHDTLVSISENSTIKAVILDFFSNAAFQVVKCLSLPVYYFYTGGASGLCVFLYLATIHKTTTKSIKELNIYFDIPGVPPIHSSEMPAVFSDRESNPYKNFIHTSSNMAKSSGIIANSFAGFEERAIATLRDGKCIPVGPTPPVYLIGPLIASMFLCFGSMGVFKKEQLKEIAFGLEKSGKRFLWVVREPPSDDVNESPHSGGKDFSLDAVLPEGFLARTSDKGLVVKNWAPQKAILNHDSVGGFVSHCGWNSSLEAVVAGVPMVAWPLYAEQKMNRVYLVEEMKVALRLKMSTDDYVTAEAVEETMTKLMEGEEGRVLRERVTEMSLRAKAAVEDGGDIFKLTQPWTDMLRDQAHAKSHAVEDAHVHVGLII